jgi:uncharacterized damage-inducible protein DinB
MKELLLQYAQYNIWANKLVIDSMLQLDEAALDQEIVSSFPTLRRTVYHTWSAEQTWLERLQLAEQPVWMESIFSGSFSEACAGWQKSSEALLLFTDKQHDLSITHMTQYADRKGNPYKTPVYQILQHVFNHSTYHRGQMVTMMRQAGVVKIPGTDFILFSRSMKG